MPQRDYAAKRLVRFNEMEYNLPVEAMEDAIGEMREKMEKDTLFIVRTSAVRQKRRHLT